MVGILLWCITFLFSTAQCSGLTITIYYMAPTGRATPSAFDFEFSASAVSLALEDYQKKLGRLTNHTFRLLVDTGMWHCNADIILSKTLDLYYSDKRPDVFFGLPCSTSLVHTGIYFSNWNLPVFPYGAGSYNLQDRSIYTTLVRIQPPGNKLAKAFTYIFRKIGWRRVAMLTTYGSRCGLSSGGIHKALQDDGIIITEWIQPWKWLPIAEEMLGEYLDRIRQRARIIILCIDDTKSHLTALRIAHEKGMRAPDYVFLYFDDNIDKYTVSPWAEASGLADTDEDVEKWRKILTEVNLKQVKSAVRFGQNYDDLYEKVPIRFSQPPWNYNYSLEMGLKGSVVSVDVYNAAWIYFTLLDEAITKGEDYRNGSLMRMKVANGVFNGYRKQVIFDENADREPDYVLFDLQPGWEGYRGVLSILAAEENGNRFIPLENMSIYWGTEGDGPPPDSPVCGFQNELCQETGNFMAIVASLAGCTVLILIVVIILLYSKKDWTQNGRTTSDQTAPLNPFRHHKEQEALAQTVWKVDYSEVLQPRARAGRLANMSQQTIQSAVSTEDVDNGAGTRQMFTEVGTYRGGLVAVLRVDKNHVHLTNRDMKEMKMMKDMNHINVAKFVGACVEPPNICYIVTYYSKGSLQDIIENDVINLEWMFKVSLLSDLAKGMAYLHRSDLQSHGSLKSTCCLVDSRWQLKVSSYGLHPFRQGKTTNEEEMYRNLLWTAPEILSISMSERPRYGTQAGDVYSFGVVAQEVIYRASPCFLDEESPKEFISRMAMDGNKTELPKVDGETPAESVDLVKSCWAADPSARPTFNKVLKMIAAVNKEKEIDIMSSLIVKLEMYANHLEDIVNKRTSELLVEKRRTDTLLESMLPKSVVEELKHGRTVDAEIFEAVTIFFSDIIGFTALSLASSPMDVVNLLNDLYSQFDEIISLHDVYKVETIGDSYMVVSGLPLRNGNRHVGEIANLALDLMSAALTFKIRHRPGLKLNLRIGFHTGPCAAGVVGLSMPRYCLFGDTVNMASRMETNGKALMIHMSRYAYEALNNLEGYLIRPRGEMQIKGKGIQMTYWLFGREDYNKPLPSFME